MVHFLRRKDSSRENSSWKDSNTCNSTITTDFSIASGTSNAIMSLTLSSLGGRSSTGANLKRPFGGGGGNSGRGSTRSSTFGFNLTDHKELLDYMVEKLPKIETVTSSLDPLYTKLMNNPCTSIDIASVPKDIMTYYDSFNESFNESFAEMNPNEACSLDVSDTSTSVSDESPANSQLRFGMVHVREYNRTVGDHPDVSDGGPPLAIDWDFIQLDPMPLLQYEAKKRKRRKRRLDRRNQRLQLENKSPIKSVPNIEFTVPRINAKNRRELLHLDFDVPFQDLVTAELEVKRVSQQREESNAQSLLSEKTEELLQSASRKLRRSLSFGWNSVHDKDKDPTKHYYAHHYANGLAPNKLLDRRQLRRSKASITPDTPTGSVASRLSASSSWSQQQQQQHHHAYTNCHRGI